MLACMLLRISSGLEAISPWVDFVDDRHRKIDGQRREYSGFGECDGDKEGSAASAFQSEKNSWIVFGSIVKE